MTLTTITPTTKRNRNLSSARLDLETARPSATTGALKLAALALNIRLLVGVRTEAEVLDCLTGILGSTKEESVAASGEPGSDLVNSESLTSGLEDASAS